MFLMYNFAPEFGKKLKTKKIGRGKFLFIYSVPQNVIHTTITKHQYNILSNTRMKAVALNRSV